MDLIQLTCLYSRHSVGEENEKQEEEQATRVREHPASVGARAIVQCAKQQRYHQVC